MQKLILPINKCKVTASWKTDAYKNRFGYTHYGVDMISAAGVAGFYASGNGLVVAVGTDSVVGNVVIVLYQNALYKPTATGKDVVFRYYHLARANVKVGDEVTKDTILGYYGNTGTVGTGAHLHLEADTDTAHPLYSPTVNSSSFIKGRAAGASDRTMTNPLEWLHCKVNTPDYQTYTTANDAYIRAEDKTLAQTN